MFGNLLEDGTLDREALAGWHDPVYRGDLEMTGQRHALHHLRRCRGGDGVPETAHHEGGGAALVKAAD